MDEKDKALFETSVSLLSMKQTPEDVRAVLDAIYRMGVLNGRILELRERRAHLEAALKAAA